MRSLKAINALNRCVSFAIALLGLLSQKGEYSQLKQGNLARAMALKKEASFFLYRYGCGAARVLAQAQEGIRA
ncbi:MAG: hypothetical protein AB9880_08530 [Christensenellales bacterium]